MMMLFLLALQAQTAPRAKPKPAPVVKPRPAPTAAKPATAPPAPATQALPPSPWTLRENKDAAAGARFASAAMSGPAGYRIAVRCDLSPDPVVSVQFIPPKPFGNVAEKLVTVLPDNGGAIILPWEFVGGGAINRTAEVFKIVEAVAAAKQVRVFTTDPNGEPISDGFEAPGGNALFRHVFDFCSTPYEPMTAMPLTAPPPPPPTVGPIINTGPIFNLPSAPKATGGPVPSSASPR